MILTAAFVLAAMTSANDVSRQLTAQAEALLQIEKKVITAKPELQSDLYEDVLTLLDSALDSDEGNAHAHALEASVLLLKSDNGDGTYDVCYLLDARDEAKAVLANSSRGSSADVAAAKAVLSDIAAIPPAAIPDSASSCDDNERESHGTRASFRAR